MSTLVSLDTFNLVEREHVLSTYGRRHPGPRLVSYLPFGQPAENHDEPPRDLSFCETQIRQNGDRSNASAYLTYYWVGAEFWL
jgi:hypothetical protein